jgi:uncharacterized protein
MGKKPAFIYLSFIKPKNNQMKKLLFVLIVIALPFISKAQDKKSDIKKLFELMHTEEMVDEIMNNVMKTVTEQGREQLEGKDKKKFEKYVEFITVEAKEMVLKLINEDMNDIYNRHFTQQEINDMITFYASSTGQKMVKETPGLTRDMLDVMMTKHLPDFQKRISDKMQELSM